MNFTVWDVKMFRLNSVAAAAQEMPVLKVGRATLT